jgi:hypothetical protein
MLFPLLIPVALMACDPDPVTEPDLGSNVETDTDTGCVSTPWYIDNDADGYGDPGTEQWSCDPIANAVSTGGDCDDTDPDAFPGAAEFCDGKWTDCAETWADDAGRVTWFATAGTPTDLSETWGLLTATEEDRQVFTESGTLAICPGTWTVPLRLDGDTIVVTGQGGPEAVILSGEGQVRVIEGSSALATVHSLTLRDGFTEDKGGLVKVATGGLWTLRDLWLSGGSAAAGGAVYASDGAAMTLSGCTFTDNQALDSGGALYVFVEEGSEFTLSDSTFHNNVSGAYGGAVAIGGYGSSTLSGVVFEDNQALLDGGALHGHGPLEIEIQNSAFTGNLALSGSGGGIWLYPDSLALFDVGFDGNFAGIEGGGAWVYGWPLTLDGLSVQNNTAVSDGGGIYVESGDGIGSDWIVSGNTSLEGCGGGLFVSADLVLSGATITANDAPMRGGGLCAYGQPELIDSTVMANTSNAGAGLYLLAHGVVDLVGTSVTAHDGTNGSAAFLEDAARLTCADSENHAGSLLENTADNAAVVLGDERSSLDSMGCDWGAPGAADDNSKDVMLSDGTWVTLGNDATLYCQDGVCE